MVTKHQWQIYFSGTFKNSHTQYINQTCKWIFDHDHAFTPHSNLRHSYTHTFLLTDIDISINLNHMIYIPFTHHNTTQSLIHDIT